MGGFVIDADPVLVYIIHNRVLHPVGFRGKNQAAVIFHHIVGARFEEAGVGPALFAGHGILGLVPVAMAVGCRQNGHFLQALPGQPVQAAFHPLRFEPGFLGVVHVPEVAAAAELGHRALPVTAVGGLFQDFHDLPGSPGFARLFDAQPHPLPGDGVGQEHGAALHMGHPLPLGGVIRHQGLVDCVLLQHNILHDRG